MGQRYWICFLAVILGSFHVLAETDTGDGVALIALSDDWQKRPTNWKGTDPCGDTWVGIRCKGTRVISIELSSLGLVGTLSGDIGSLTELQTLDLSYNVGLSGSLPSAIGKLTKLTNFILVGCGFSGPIPDLSSLKQLVFLSLNSNRFTGRIPHSIGSLTKLYWLDLADNKLTGTIPISDGKTLGLDNLKKTKHFHFGNNRLSGSIPPQLLSSDMTLIHLLFENNSLSGGIPSTLGLVKDLEVVRLDRNSLTGPVPSNINNLTTVGELYLSNNELTGSLPDLTGMNALTYLDLSNNSFEVSDVPPWFSTLKSLTTLVLEFLRIRGQLPAALFSSPQLQTVRLKNNLFNGTLNISTHSSQLQLVDLQNNRIEYLVEGGAYKKNLMLMGNPFCDQRGPDNKHCKPEQEVTPSYETEMNCVNTCFPNLKLSPTCKCAVPYSGTFYFRAVSFSDLDNSSHYRGLEKKLMSTFQSNQLAVDIVSLHNISKDPKNYLKVNLNVFPSSDEHFNQTEVSFIGFILSNQTFKPPTEFGPFVFEGVAYNFPPDTTKSSKSNNLPLITGASVAGLVVVLIITCLAIFAFRQKRKADVVTERSQPFASWDTTNSSGSTPQLKGARRFTFDELKHSTYNFSGDNEIGSGGYGKVYKGLLPNGQIVAIKRAQQESMQGGLEFKTEIEMLSRVHHKNLVSLIGFCFDQGEQMLVYEYVPNGSLRDSLSGKSGIRLDWRKRLRVAIGAARGLSYLHELANPPIIHRDVKSSNILLDEELNAKVSDFGLSKLLGDGEKDHITTQVKGTMGYLDPEYYMTQQLTEKSDVYGFGVLMLELITGRKPIERGKYIVRELKMKMNKSMDLYGLHGLLDSVLVPLPSLGGFEGFVDLAMRCVAESGVDRPTMSEVMKDIDGILQLARLNQIADSGSSSYMSEGTSSGQPRHPYNDEVAAGCSTGIPVPR